MSTALTRNSDAPPSRSNAEPRALARVLVVEDDAIASRLLKKFLRAGGFAYESAPSALDALHMLEQRPAPDLIVSDISMPGMDGIEFCRRLRSSERLRDLPLIFTTAKSDVDTLNRAFAAGANDYIRKPVHRDELHNRSLRLIQEYRRRLHAKERLAALDRENRQKSKFLGVASHDLRNPLVSIRGIAQFLNSERFGPLNDGQKEMVETIAQASQSMLALVEDLLEVSKTDAQPSRPNLERLSLRDAARQAESLHRPTAQAKDIELVLVDNAERSEALIDPKLFSRVVDNLVTNAIKFSYPGTRVFIVLDSFADKVSLSVEDEGPGIPEGEFGKLFKEFSRTSNQPTAGESSSGIGLFMSKNIVTHLGGEIVAENREARGARFLVTFNYAQP